MYLVTMILIVPTPVPFGTIGLTGFAAALAAVAFCGVQTDDVRIENVATFRYGNVRTRRPKWKSSFFREGSSSDTLVTDYEGGRAFPGYAWNRLSGATNHNRPRNHQLMRVVRSHRTGDSDIYERQRFDREGK